MSAKDKAPALCPSAIRAHAWNAAGDQVAVVPNGKDIVIYAAEGTDCRQWQLLHTLSRHEQRVLGVDWHPETQRLLSCAEDRMAYVWELEGGQWEPKVVHLGPAVNRAVLCCSWAPKGLKFAVGTGARLVCVCSFDPEQHWWVGQAFKHHDSSVTALAWHPTHGALLATCSTDNHVRFFSAALKNVDQGETFGKFGTLVAKIPARAWVHDCKWSPDGAHLAFISHDSTLSVVDMACDYAVQTVKTRLLPFTSLAFPEPATIVAACSDCFLYTFGRGADGAWALTGRLKGRAHAAQESSSVSLAMTKFQLEAATGQAAAVDRLDSAHQNLVAQLRVLVPGPQWRVSSAGYDGMIYIWEPSDVQPM